MNDGRFEDACPKFEESLRLDHGMGTQFNLAHCWEKLGRTASAWALFLDVAAEARASDQPQREAAARDRAKAIEPKLTRLRIDVPEAVAGTRVERDGQDLGEAAWGTAVPIDPGKHVIHVSAPGKSPWSDEIDVPAEPRTVSITVPSLADAAPEAQSSGADAAAVSAAPVEADVDVSRSGGSNGQTVAALIVGGVGLAAVATGTVFALQSRSDNDKALELCHTPSPTGEEGCFDAAEQRRHSSLVDSAERNRTIGLVGFGVGGAALVTALILYVTADEGSESGRAAFDVTPVWMQGFQGAAISGSF